MHLVRVILIVLVALVTACGEGCLELGSVPTANEKLPGEWTVDGESRTLETAFVSPNIARAGETTSFEVFLPPGTTRVYGAVSPDPDVDCMYEHPCTPGEKWTELEFDPESKSWRGNIEVTDEVIDAWDSLEGVLPNARVLYQASETRFDSLSRGLVLASESRGIYWVASEADVDELCTSDPCIVQGDLYVWEWEGDDLQALRQVDTVWGDLSIGFNDDLATLSGVEDIRVNRELSLFQNAQLRTLEPLGGVVELTGFYAGSLPALEEPIDLEFVASRPPDPSNPPDYGFKSVPINSDVFGSFPRGSRVSLLGELGTSLVAGGGEFFLSRVSVRETDVERIVAPAARQTEVVGNKALVRVELMAGFDQSIRGVSIAENDQLESVGLPPGENFRITISDSPGLRDIDGLETLGPESRLFLYDVPNLRRCDLEVALPAQVFERSEFREIGACED